MLWPNSDDVHRADSICICDVIVFVGVDADIVEVLRNLWCGEATDRAGYVQLKALWWTLDFQWNQDWKVASPELS